MLSGIISIIIVCQVLAQGPQILDGDVLGKLAVYYHGGFFAQDDGSPTNVWNDWTKSNDSPSKNMVTFELYPDVREYNKLYQTQLSNLGNGQPAKLFSSWDVSTLDLHFRWMLMNKIDVVAVQVCYILIDYVHSRNLKRKCSLDFQRLGRHIVGNPLYGAQADEMIRKIRTVSAKFDLRFYITWNLSDWTNYETELDTDVNRVSGLGVFSHPYAHQRSNDNSLKPVIGLQVIDITKALGILKIIKNSLKPAYYVICGVPKLWLRWNSTYEGKLADACDMIQSWPVGELLDIGHVVRYQFEDLGPGFEFVRSHNTAYQAVLFPGFAISNNQTGARNKIPRLHGDFLWSQFANLRAIGIRSAMVYSFDGYNDATAIAKAAEDSSMIPIDQYFLRLDVDGVRVSSDFYLRVTAEGNRLMNRQIGYKTSHEIPFSSHSVSIHSRAGVYLIPFIVLVVIVKVTLENIT